MVNRVIEQKILKMKRRNRHAVFSGATARHVHHRTVEVLDPVRRPDGSVDEDKIRVKEVRVKVGPISLSKAVINTGRGPDNERMQEYYQRIHSYGEALPKTLGFTGINCSTSNEKLLKYQELIRDAPKECRINYLDDYEAKLDLFFAGPQWFWVEINYKKHYARRSKIYPNKRMAELMLELDKITWVETT